ncbi:hypothetical protein QL285_059012 [Trifolium repens]|nr:hypothetical protein QL285_059012 [Trifolium repens]
MANIFNLSTSRILVLLVTAFWLPLLQLLTRTTSEGYSFWRLQALVQILTHLASDAHKTLTQTLIQTGSEATSF